VQSARTVLRQRGGHITTQGRSQRRDQALGKTVAEKVTEYRGILDTFLLVREHAVQELAFGGHLLGTDLGPAGDTPGHAVLKQGTGFGHLPLVTQHTGATEGADHLVPEFVHRIGVAIGNQR
jgi:hypothetical protein